SYKSGPLASVPCKFEVLPSAPQTAGSGPAHVDLSVATKLDAHAKRHDDIPSLIWRGQHQAKIRLGPARGLGEPGLDSAARSTGDFHDLFQHLCAARRIRRR